MNAYKYMFILDCIVVYNQSQFSITVILTLHLFHVVVYRAINMANTNCGICFLAFWLACNHTC